MTPEREEQARRERQMNAVMLQVLGAGLLTGLVIAAPWHLRDQAVPAAATIIGIVVAVLVLIRKWPDLRHDSGSELDDELADGGAVGDRGEGGG